MILNSDVTKFILIRFVRRFSLKGSRKLADQLGNVKFILKGGQGVGRLGILNPEISLEGFNV